ncbi:MAG: heavy metal translocating P-type ATPase [Myxococcales bacterium]|nr:heavy metal translocating P-type ATPase [Myxococcales bacterium]
MVDCAHCGLPVPSGLLPARDDEPAFCCNGCRAVYQLLHEEGLSGYYTLADGAERAPARVTDRSYDELDDEAFTRRYCRAGSDGSTRDVELYLEGVHCAACVWVVERLPELCEGVVSARLDAGRSVARITYAPDTPLSGVARKLDRLGYPVHPLRGESVQRARRAEDRRLLVRIAVAGAAAGNVMLYAAALYAGAFDDMAPQYVSYFRWASLLVALPAALWAGAIFFRGALGALRARSLHMDLPISIGIAAGLGWGAVNTVRGSGEVYFDTVCVLVFLLLIGRWLQRRQHRSAADAAELLQTLTPSFARVVREEALHDVPVEALAAGDIVEVRAGESMPVDGVVVEGRSAIDSSLLSGESRPRRCEPGDQVHAGTVNLGSRLRIEVVAAGEETRAGKLMQAIAEAANRRAPIVKLADRVAGYFVAATLLLAIVTGIVWWQLAPEMALEHAISLLIVTCPCALGLATPLAVTVTIGRAARAGILIKGGDALERLAATRAKVLIDKTGTLTRGEQRLVQVCPLGEDGVADSADLLQAVAALERHSAHPIARACVRDIERDHGQLAVEAIAVDGVEERTGAGISGQVRWPDGTQATLSISSARRALAQLAADGLQPSSSLRAVLRDIGERALSPVVVQVDGAPRAVLAFGDALRDDARETVDALRALGLELAILSGDHAPVVAAIARELDIDDYEGDASPERKLQRVEQELARGASSDGARAVMMVGDGVNDAAALAAATAGVAVHGGAEASLEVADVYIKREGLAALAELVRGARACRRTIRRNLIFSLAYNLAGATLAATGLIGPLIAAVLMPLSSITVLASSLRGARFEIPEPVSLAADPSPETRSANVPRADTHVAAASAG